VVLGESFDFCKKAKFFGKFLKKIKKMQLFSNWVLKCEKVCVIMESNLGGNYV